jgi:phage shock protein PspC (stress-responsive transcriptional regulator)
MRSIWVAFLFKESIMHRLSKIYQAGCLSGVCAGIAYSLGFPTMLIRATFLFFMIATPVHAWLAYILLAIVLPRYNGIPEDYYRVCE